MPTTPAPAERLPGAIALDKFMTDHDIGPVAVGRAVGAAHQTVTAWRTGDRKATGKYPARLELFCAEVDPATNAAKPHPENPGHWVSACPRELWERAKDPEVVPFAATRPVAA